MRIEGPEGAGSGSSNTKVQVKEEPVSAAGEVQEANGSSSSNNSALTSDTKPMTEVAKGRGSYSTRGVKIKYQSDGDDDFEPEVNKKQRRRGARIKAELPDIGGYKPTKKRMRKDPTRCHVCRQKLDDPKLNYFPGPPADAMEEVIALTDPSLSLFTGDEELTSELDQRPILKLTQFGIYDKPGHLCAIDGGAIEANHLLYAYGYVKPVWAENSGPEDGIPTKEIGPINEWFISGFDGGEKAIMCECYHFKFNIIISSSSHFKI